MRKIILDTETTGLDPIKGGHRIIEIGAIEMIDFTITGNVFHTYINPERDVPLDAFRVHGISAEFLKDKRVFKDIVKEFLEFIAGAKLVIHNAPFDLKFINYELKLLSLENIFMRDVIDTLDIARKTFPGSPASLDALCRRFKINTSSRAKHGALLDAEFLSAVYIELCSGNQTGLAFSNKRREEIASKVEVSVEAHAQQSYIKIGPTDAEIEAHKELLKLIKEPIWEN